MLRQIDTPELRSLKQLKAVSFEMLAFAETGNWDAVLKCDNARVQILKNLSLQSITHTDAAHESLVKTILELDIKIQAIAGKERQEIMDKQIHQKAQKAAQSSYEQALSTGSG